MFTPIQIFADYITYGILNLTPDSYLGPAVNFFIYDVIKIGLLLIVINYLMAVMRYYLPVEKLKTILSSRNWYGLDYFIAAILGMITPFCSCSSIPLFIGFLSARIPVGVTFTFLIASPLINEASLILFPAIFGVKAALLYNVLGIVIAIVGGMLIEKFAGERYIKSEILEMKTRKQITIENKGKELPLRKLMKFWWKDCMVVTKKIYPYVLLGIAVGALIHGFVPDDFIETYFSKDNWYSVPLATILGVPLYANSITIIPIIQALIGKGVAAGTAIAFMTATVTLSIPEALILKTVMKWQLLVVFFGITTIGIMVIGFVFNFVF